MNIQDFINELSAYDIRTLSCTECKHKTASDNSHKKIFCDICNDYVQNNTSKRCKFYKPYLDKSEHLIRGYKIRQFQTQEYLTENQWNKKGFRLKDTAKGTLMYASEVSAKKYPENLIRYYTKEEVEENE